MATTRAEETRLLTAAIRGWKDEHDGFVDLGAASANDHRMLQAESSCVGRGADTWPTQVDSMDAETRDNTNCYCGPLSTNSRKTGSRWTTWLSTWTIFLAVATTLNLVAATVQWTSYRQRSELDKITKTDFILQEVKTKYQEVSFNGLFNKETIYRQNASPEVDAAWEALGVDARPFLIDHEVGLENGLTDAYVQTTNHEFLVNVEGLHHLHCLNLLRQGLYFNHDYYKAQGSHAFANAEPILRLHITHCLDILRQVLMCHVDTGVLGQVWWNETHPAPFPDFNTKHMCKGFEGVRKFAVEKQLPPPEELPSVFLQPPLRSQVLAEIP